MLKKIPKILFYILFIMLFIILFFVMLSVTKDIRGVISRSLRPVFYGAVLAYLFKPMCNFFKKRLKKLFDKCLSERKSKKLSHYLSMLLTYIVFGAILYFLVLIIIPQLYESIKLLVSYIPGFYNTVIQFVHGIVEDNPELEGNIQTVLNVVYNTVSSWFNGSLLPLLSGITGGVMVTFTFLLNLFIGVIVSVYLLNGRKKFGAQAKLIIKSIFPKNQAEAIFSEARYADRMFSGYFAGTIIDSALVAVLCYLLCLITGMPFPILVSVIVGVANVIPFFGPYIGMIPSAVIILTVSPVKALIFVIMIWILQQVDGNIIAPKIIGSSVGLSSFWVLFAILLFGGLYGFFGMIIGSPIFAVIYHVVGKVIRKYARIRGEEEFLSSYEAEFPQPEPKPSLRSLFKSKDRGDGGAEETVTAASDGVGENSEDGGAETEASETDSPSSEGSGAV